MLDQIIANISDKKCLIIHLDLTEYKNELTVPSLKKLRKVLELNNTIRKIIWPKYINSLTQQIDADLQKKFKTSIPGSVAINQYKNTPFFHKIIERNADIYAKNTAVVNVDGKSINYIQLNEQANQLAYYLSRVLNLPKGTVLGVFLSRSKNYIVSIIACMKAGLIFVPIDTDSEKVSNERIDHYLTQCMAKHVLTEHEQVNRANKLSTKPHLLNVAEILSDEKIINIATTKSNPSIQIQSTDISYIYFSSGSTGEPKGIPIEYGGLLNRIVAHIDVLALTQKDNGAQYATVAFDASLMEITMMLSVGGCLTIVPNEYRLDVRKTGNFYKDTKITVAIFVPSSLAVLNPKDFNHLRLVLSTGEPVSSATIKRWREEGYSSGPRKFINGYGDTEGTIAWTLGECVDEVHIGESILACHLYLLKKIKKEEISKFQNQTDISRSVIKQKISENKIRYWLVCQNSNEQGEIWLAGNGLTPGYLNQELNKKAFVEHPVLGRLYRTYNIAKYDIKGKCQIVDRKGRRLKIHGQFVEPKEIDNAIEKNNFQKVAKAFVSTRTYVLPDNPEYKRHHLIAYVEPRNNQKINILELFKSLRNLPRYMVPARWVVMDKLPTNNNGKIDRKKLSSDKSPFDMARFNKLTPPRDGMSGYEEQIQDIWCRLLGLEKNDISIHDDFFYLGGDSLLFMQMIDNLKEEFSNKDLTQLQTVSASTLAFNPTIAAISRFIRLDEQRFDFIDYSLRRENGDKSPLILIPPITGDLGNAYSKFVEKIPIDRSVVGLKYPGHQNILNMYDTVEEHARDCSEAIISLRNKRNISGPILLFGYSSGGIIAYEIAKILIAKNYKVYVFICDSIAPDFYQKADQNQIKKLSDSLLLRFINYFGVDPKKLAEASHTVEENNYEFIANELNRLLPQLKSGRQKYMLDFVKKIKLAEINYDQDPIKDIQNDSKIILLSADKTIEFAGGDDRLYWSNCINAVVSYEADHDNILEKVTSDASFYELLEEADNKIIYTWNIPSLVSGYIPRVELTSEIKAYFSGKGFTQSVICALSGQSGTGKTMLATNIINASTHYLQRLYFNASSAHQLKRELLDFAKKQNISNVTHKNIFHHIQLWLKEHPGGLLVLDNCNKEKLLEFIPSSGWHVLITTTHLTNPKYHFISVNGMKENEANKLLATSCIDIVVNNQLARMVNYQPLYLRLLNTYLRSYQQDASIKAQELIRHFKLKNLLPEKLKFEISKIAFERFQTINYPAMQLLHELSYFNGSKISHLLVKLLIASGDAIKENNQFLSITNFLKENDLIHEMGNESFYIHPGLQELLKKEFETKNIKSLDAILLKSKENNSSSSEKQELNNSHLMSICQKLISLYPFEKTERCYYEFCQQLKPHIKVLLEFATSDNLYQIKMLRMLADSYQANGNYFKQVSCIKKAKDLVESAKYGKMKHDYEANIQKALVYIDFVKSRLSIMEQFRHLELLIQAKNIFEIYFNDLSRSNEIAKIEVELNYILTQMGELPRDKSIGYIDHLLHILPWESFERASVLKKVFSIFPLNKQDRVLQAACTIYENNDAAHPDLSLIYKQLYLMQKSKGVAQTQFLEKALDITIEVNEFYHTNFDTFSLFTLLINDYYTQCTSRNLQDIGAKIDKTDYYVKFFKYLIKKLQNNLMQFTENPSMRPLLPKVLCQEEKLKNNIKFNNRESVMNNAYNKSLLEIIKDIQQYCIKILGKPPCEFVINVLGSSSYGLAIRGSDFEFCVVIPPGYDHIQRQFIDHYFQCFLPLFETFFKIAFANTGCQIDRGVSPHIKYDRTLKKYNIKGFYGTPEDILDKHCKLTSNKSNKEGGSKVSLYQLLNPLYLMGNQDLYQNFLVELRRRLKANINSIPFYKAYAEEQLELHSKEYIEAYKAYYEQLKSPENSLALAEKQEYLIKIKKLVAHPLVFMVFDIALYTNRLFKNKKIYSSIFELISVLKSKLILKKTYGDALETTLCDVTKIRSNINDDNYDDVTFFNDKRLLLSICDELLSEFAKNREDFFNSKLIDKENNEQYEEESDEQNYDEPESLSPLRSAIQPFSPTATSPIKSISNNADSLEDDVNFPPLSIHRRGRYFAGNNKRQPVIIPLSSPIRNVNTSLDQSTDSPWVISPSIIKQAGIDGLFHDDDEYYSSDEYSINEYDEDENWNSDNDVDDKWDIYDDIYLKVKSQKYQEQSEGDTKRRTKGFKSKLKKVKDNSDQYMLDKDTMTELRQMKVDVNNKKTSLKSKNYQKEQVKYFKKTKASDDNLRIRVGRNRKKNVTGNKCNTYKYICIDDTVNGIIISNNNSDDTININKKPMIASVSQTVNNEIAKPKKTTDHANRRTLKKPKLVSTFKVTKKHLQKIDYLLKLIPIELNYYFSVYFADKQLHPKLYGLYNKTLVQRESLIINEFDKITTESAQLDLHAVLPVHNDPTIPEPFIYFIGDEYILNYRVLKKLPALRGDVRIIKVTNRKYVGTTPFSNDATYDELTSNEFSKSQFLLKNFNENDVMEKQIEARTEKRSVTHLVSNNNSVVNPISANNENNNKLLHMNLNESQLLFKNSSTNEAMKKQIEEQKNQLSFINSISGDHSVVPIISPDTVINNFVQREPSVIGTYYLRRPSIGTLFGMLVDDPDYLKLIFEKDAPDLSNNPIYGMLHNSVYHPTYHLDSYLTKSQKSNISINNNVIPCNEFFYNLNRYIVDCKILNLSNLSLDDEDMFHLAENLSNNKTLLYLSLKLNNITIRNIEYFSRAVLCNSTLLAIRFEKSLFERGYSEIFLNHPALNAVKISLYLNNYTRLCYVEQLLKQTFDNYTEGNDIDLSNIMLCDDGAKQLTRYLMKINFIIPKLNLENNYITLNGWKYITYALFNYSAQELKCSKIIFEQGNFDIYFPKQFFNELNSSNPHVYSSYDEYTNEMERMFSSSHSVGQRNFNWECRSETLKLVPQVEVLPLMFERLSTSFHSITENLLSSYSQYTMIKFPIFVIDILTPSGQKHPSLFQILSGPNLTPTEIQEHTFNRRTYQKNIRATFFYNTSGRQAEHQRRHAPTKPNFRIRKGN